MKRLMTILVTIILLFTLSACNISSLTKTRMSVKTNYYLPELSLNKYDPNTSIDSIPDSDKIALTDKQLQFCEEIIKKIQEKYDTTEQDCSIMQVSKKHFERDKSHYSYAFYRETDKCIYLREGFSEKDISYFTHEYFHYLSNPNQNGLGAIYIIDIDNSKYQFGNTLNEGMTNYFSTQITPHPSDTSIYEFETHLSALLSIAFGEDNLWEAFSSNDLTELKNDFNSKLSKYYEGKTELSPELTTFDWFVNIIDIYGLILTLDYTYAESGQANEWIDMFVTLVNGLEEFTFNYCIASGKTEEAQEEVERFMKTQHLNLRELSDIYTITGVSK